MRISLLALLVAVMLVGAVSAQYHDSKYLFGGYGTTSSLYAQGPWLADAGNQTFTKLGPGGTWYQSYGMAMDVDNKKVICLPRGTTSTSYQYKGGIFRIDPTTNTMVTVFQDANLIYSNCGPVHVNQDGDYVFAAYSRSTQSSTTQYHYRLYKVPSLGGTASTLYSSTKFFNLSTTCYQGGQADIDTGDYVLQVYNTNIRYGILNLSLDGSTLTTWSTGGTYGLYTYNYDNLMRDWDTGNWECIYGDYIYQLTQGTMTRTTLYNLGYPGALRVYYGCKHDLRSSGKRTARLGGYIWNSNPTYYEPAVLTVDMSGPPYAVTYVSVDPQRKTARQYNYCYAFNFYRGRHVQTLMTAPKKWQMRISCPNYAGKSYVAAVSISGYKPAIPLPDGRKIYLRPDNLTQPSLNGWLKPVFDPGPGKLDANGEAVGGLDFSSLPSIGLPMWISVLVLDPKAPNGIAYIPDTFVFKTP